MMKITGILEEIKMINGKAYTTIENGKPAPMTVQGVIMDSIEMYAFPSRATAKDLKDISKMLTIGETLYNSKENELIIEDEDLETLKNMVNAPQQTKVAPVVAYVLNILENAEKVKVEEKVREP